MNSRRWIAALLLIFLFAALPVTALAAGDDAAQLPHVSDYYGLLTTREAAALEAQAKQLSQEYGCSLYILIVKDYRDYAEDTFRFAMQVFQDYSLGWGSEQTGAMLMLSMADRDFELMFNGSDTDRIFTEYGRDKMTERFLEYFRRDDFAGGFGEFLNTCAEYLEADRNGKPFDEPKSFSFLFFLPGVITSAIAGVSLSAPMKSTGEKHDANEYLVDGKVNLTEQSDLFLHRTVTRTPRQTSSDRSGGSGSSHRSGSSSGRSGKF